MAATTATRAVQRIRPHVPLIQFPKQRPQPGAGLTALNITSATKSSEQKSAATSGKGSGIDELQLPAFLQRRTITKEEIDIINPCIKSNNDCYCENVLMEEEKNAGKTLLELLTQFEALVSARNWDGVEECAREVIELSLLSRKGKAAKQRLNLVSLSDKNGTLLPALLGILESTRDGLVVEALVSALNVYIDVPRPQKRLRGLVQGNAVQALCKQVILSAKTSTKRSMFDSLVELLITIAAKDRKAGLKIRLGGLLQLAASEVTRSGFSAPLLPSFSRILLFGVKYGRNAQFFGKQKNLMQWLFSSSESSEDAEMVHRNMEILFYLSRGKQNRQRMHTLGAASILLGLFDKFFKLRLDEGPVQVCLVILGCLRQLSKTKSGREHLTGIGGLGVLEKALEESLKDVGESEALRELDASLATLCLRCLPPKILPLADHFFPINFPLPSSENRKEKGEDSEESDDDEEGGLPMEEKNDLESEEDSELDSERDGIKFEKSDPGDVAKFRKFFSELFDAAPTSFIEAEYEGDSPKTTPGLLQNRRSRSEDVNVGRGRKNGVVQRKPSGGGKLGVKKGGVSALYKRNIAKASGETKCVSQFVKIAYPDFTDGFPDLPRQPLKLFPNAIKQTVLGELSKLRSEEIFNPRTVYDLDSIIQKELTSLENDDLKRLGNSDTVDHLVFESRFESGNLRKAVQVGKYEYDLFLSPDINQLSLHYQWFYFEVSNMEAAVPYTFNVCNCLKSHSMFSNGMQPVVFSVTEARDGRPGWVRAGQRVCYFRNSYTSLKTKEAPGFYTSSFTLTFRHSYDVCYVAYHFPFTYSFLKVSIRRLLGKRSADAFVRCETLTTSLGGNKVPVLTVSAPGSAEEFQKREYIVLSSRVHPGESNASWMMQGSLRFLLSDSREAEALRKVFIFKIIPMLNPDGVINGSHRCSLAGQDLNRQWAEPSPTLHPVIFHAKGLMQLLTASGKPPWLFCDYHGHSRKYNVFVFGNNPEESWWVPDHSLEHDFAFLELPKILDTEAPSFCLNDCRFAIQKSKEPSARVVVWRQMNVPRSYTMESTYCGCDAGPYQGQQLGTRELMEMGQRFCASLLTLRKREGFLKKERSPSSSDA